MDGRKESRKELNPFEIAVKMMDHSRRIEDLEGDMKTLKPIVYGTAESAKRIEKAVEKMEANSEKTQANSEKIKGYIQAAVITAVVGIIVLALKTLFGLEV